VLKELPPVWGGLTAPGVTPPLPEAQTGLEHLPGSGIEGGLGTQRIVRVGVPENRSSLRRVMNLYVGFDRSRATSCLDGAPLIRPLLLGVLDILHAG
jgi:hypothetical protein